MEVAQQLLSDGQEVGVVVMIQTMHPAVIYFDKKLLPWNDGGIG